MAPRARPDLIPRVLIVDDDFDLRTEMAAYLAGQGCEVFEAADAPSARLVLARQAISVIILDVNLPGEDGLSFCRSLSGNNGPPILMLSALGEPIDRIVGLELGADDYVVKPIPPRELLARVRALLRRRPANDASTRFNTYRFANFTFDLSAMQLRAPSGTVLMLTRGELTILMSLLDRPRAVVTRAELLLLIRGEHPDRVGRAVDLHISRLRRKIHAQADQELIKTHRGVGYLLDAAVSAE